MISLTLLQNDQNGEHIQKSHTYFFFVIFRNTNKSRIYSINTGN